MEDERPLEPENEVPSDSQLEDELDQVLSAASSLVETLADEVGTPDDDRTDSGSTESKDEIVSDEPDFMAELTQSAGPAPASATPKPLPKPESKHLGAGSNAIASPENLGVIGSADVGVIGNTASATQADDFHGDLETFDATDLVDDLHEPMTEQESHLLQRVVAILGSIGVRMLALIAPLLDLLDRPLSGLSQPIRNAMGVFAIATLATAMVVLAISFW